MNQHPNIPSLSAAPYTVEEVAGMVGRSKDWLWAQCRDRKVPHHRAGRHYKFSEADVKAISAMTAPVPVEVAP